jgi:hypothetical protein
MTSSAADTTTAPKPKPASPILGVAAMIAAVSLFWTAAENHYGQCVAAQVAKYPAVAVSAFQTEETGPLKVAYDSERRDAVGKCKRFLFV